MKDTNIGFIGCGNMARSLIGGLIADGHPAGRISGADPDPEQRERMRRLDVEVYDDNDELIRGADVVVLAVKPQLLPAVLRAAAPALGERRPLVISIAAGIRLETLRHCLGTNLPVVRVMPNTPSLIQAGAAALVANAAVSAAQRDLAEGIMRAVGAALWLEDEALMDAVTAVSGSGPAYFFLVMEAMIQAGEKLGLPAETARLLTLETALGAARMALESESDPAALRRQVTSKGGTTEQALEILMQEGDLEGLFYRAMSAAKRRSEELAAELGEQ